MWDDLFSPAMVLGHFVCGCESCIRQAKTIIQDRNTGDYKRAREFNSWIELFCDCSSAISDETDIDFRPLLRGIFESIDYRGITGAGVVR